MVSEEEANEVDGIKLDALLELFENNKDKDKDNDEEDDNLHLTLNGKFDILNEYFGISCLPIPPTAGNE